MARKKMIIEPDKILTWQMVQPTIRKHKGETIPGKFELVEIPVPELKKGEVLVEVAGCGVGQTDLRHFYDGVPTVCSPPLTLGREISGRVVAGDPSWIGKEVVIPAVMPCGTCRLCMSGRANRCLNQTSPGNSTGIYGGFASHIPIPSANLCEITNCRGIPLEHLAVVADTVAAAYQAARRASIEVADTVLVIGTAGMGKYLVQTAKALGAGTVIAVDSVETRLRKMLAYGADVIINAAGKHPDDVSAEVKRIRDEIGLPDFGWKIFETTGSASGRETASTLLSYADKVIVVGSGTANVRYDMNQLAQFGAEIIGSRGCLPEHYPQVLDLVTSGRIAVSPFVLTRPMSWIREIFDELHKTTRDTHYILTPDDFGLDTDPEPKSCR
jgi:6-hydroxycyclohex-1-ene-1-carbonyl-CoA dehydrogenase